MRVASPALTNDLNAMEQKWFGARRPPLAWTVLRWVIHGLTLTGIFISPSAVAAVALAVFVLASLTLNLPVGIVTIPLSGTLLLFAAFPIWVSVRWMKRGIINLEAVLLAAGALLWFPFLWFTLVYHHQ